MPVPRTGISTIVFGAERDRVFALSSRLDRIELVLLPIVIALMALARLR